MTSEEMLKLMSLAGIPQWKQWDGSVSRHVLRRQAGLTPLEPFIRFIQSRHLAHVMRLSRSRIDRQALVGRFVFDIEEGSDHGKEAHLFRPRYASAVGPAERKVPDILKDFLYHMKNKCGLIPGMVKQLTEPHEDLVAQYGTEEGKKHYLTRKAFMYAAQREAYIGDTIADWCRDGECDGTEEVASRYLSMQLKHGRRSTWKREEDHSKWERAEALYDTQGHLVDVIGASAQSFDAVEINGGEQLLPLAGGTRIDPLTASSGEIQLLFRNIHPQFLANAQPVALVVKSKAPCVIYMIKLQGQETREDIKKAALKGDLARSSGWHSSSIAITDNEGTSKRATQCYLAPDTEMRLTVASGFSVAFARALTVDPLDIYQSMRPTAAWECPLCRWKPEGDFDWYCPRTAHNQFLKHADNHHADLVPPHTALEKRMSELAVAEQSKEQTRRKNRLLRILASGMRVARKAGPRRRANRKLVEKLYCKHCKMVMTTSIGSMEQHILAHKRRDFIILGRIKKRQLAHSGRAVGDLRFEVRPEQHTFCRRTQRNVIGGDARLWKIVVPPEAWTTAQQKKIKCRKCYKFELDFDEMKQTMRSKAKMVSIMRKHESKCKHRNE
ncbi:unnamed protein product [Amoebophrya sp. A25]|nr:unnamed protein product [Amoebophrya sp. A25]|eukprot:GSA25T00019722001.1